MNNSKNIQRGVVLKAEPFLCIAFSIILLPLLYGHNVSHTPPTLKSPLSMMSMILYCWLTSFNSTRFLSAFSWSFLLVSNSRLSDIRGQDDTWWAELRRLCNPFVSLWIINNQTDTEIETRTHIGSQSWKDTDLQVGVMPWPLRVRVRWAEGSSGKCQEHGARTFHGQQGSAERDSDEDTSQSVWEMVWF